MNRIDEIKEKVNDADKIRAEVGELSELDELYLSDVAYLLSLNERYKRTYQEYVHKNEWGCEFLNEIDGKCISCNRRVPVLEE